MGLSTACLPVSKTSGHASVEYGLHEGLCCEPVVAITMVKSQCHPKNNLLEWSDSPVDHLIGHVFIKGAVKPGKVVGKKGNIQ